MEYYLHFWKRRPICIRNERKKTVVDIQIFVFNYIFDSLNFVWSFAVTSALFNVLLQLRKLVEHFAIRMDSNSQWARPAFAAGGQQSMTVNTKNEKSGQIKLTAFHREI